APAPVGVLEPQLVLIGGWGTWFHTGGLHSYDICLIASPGGLDKLIERFGPMSALPDGPGPKWHTMVEGFALACYVAGESLLGKTLELQVGELAKRTQPKGRIRVLSASGQAATKLAELLDHPNSVEGEADRADIWALSRQGVEPRVLATYLRASTKARSDVAELAEIGLSLLEDLDLNRPERAELRRWRREVVARLGPELPPGLDRRRGL
ncbi:MAG: hypothetical protein ACRDX8_05820, partial [Acidimicrobiales bacterium]